MKTSKDITFDALRRYNLHADKKFGQNFLIDDDVLQKIIGAAQIQKDDIILEVGPGIGVLTQLLAQSGCKKVIAVELDKRLTPVLSELEAKHSNLQVVYQDIMQMDIRSLIGDASFKVVANLPYYITTPIIMKFLESDFNYERLVIMVQNEVAQRMASLPDSKVYGALSIAVQYRTEAKVSFKVLPSAFIPPPKVDSAVIVCKKRTQPFVDVDNEQAFFQIVKAAFSQRRKMICNTLKNIGLTSEQTNLWLNAAQIDGKKRAENLSIQDFARLERVFNKW